MSPAAFVPSLRWRWCYLLCWCWADVARIYATRYVDADAGRLFVGAGGEAQCLHMRTFTRTDITEKGGTGDRKRQIKLVINV